MNSDNPQTQGPVLGNGKTFADVDQTLRKDPDQAAVEKKGVASGFDRDAPPPKKPVGRPKAAKPTGNIHFRAELEAIEAFRDICGSMDPEWTMGYTFKRCVAALQKELD